MGTAKSAMLLQYIVKLTNHLKPSSVLIFQRLNGSLCFMCFHESWCPLTCHNDVNRIWCLLDHIYVYPSECRFGPVNLFWSTRYDKAMTLFLTCLKEFSEFANMKDQENNVPPEKCFKLPYKWVFNSYWSTHHKIDAWHFASTIDYSFLYSMCLFYQLILRSWSCCLISPCCFCFFFH